VMKDVGRVKEGFGGHATLQDAEAAELFGTVHDGDAFAEVGGDAGGVEAGGAAAENDEIEGGVGREAGARRGHFLRKLHRGHERSHRGQGERSRRVIR